ncbi:hypothetical protein VPH35_010967 [Triticum aestivum]
MRVTPLCPSPSACHRRWRRSRSGANLRDYVHCRGSLPPPGRPAPPSRRPRRRAPHRRVGSGRRHRHGLHLSRGSGRPSPLPRRVRDRAEHPRHGRETQPDGRTPKLFFLVSDGRLNR